MELIDFLSHLSNVRQTATGYTAQCPAHQDRRASLSISQGDDGKILLNCFAGCTFDDICQAVGVEPKDLMPAPAPGSRRRAERPKERIVATYDYREMTGELRYQVVRMEPKSFRQRRPHPDRDGDWIWGLAAGEYFRTKTGNWYRAKKGAPDAETFPECPRTIYRMPEIAEAIRAGKAIFIPEGEKDVHTLVDLGLHATCNSGGAGKWPSDASAIFSGAKVIIIPDNDTPRTDGSNPGMDHALKVAKSLQKHASQVRILAIEHDGKDITDWIDAGNTLQELIKLATQAPLAAEFQRETTNPARDTTPTTKTTPYEEPAATPFRFLGYNDGYYHYLPNEDLQLIRLSPDQHTQSALISLAPLQWWEGHFFGRTGTDWNAAKNFMFRRSKKTGIYDNRRLRGCGTWYDEGRVVQHNGDILHVDGEPIDINKFKTRYIYNASYPIEPEPARPLANKEAFDFLRICRMPTWEKPISGTLLAGWCVVAPICGALQWRPHIWLTGASGTGKTWIMDNLIKPTAGDLAVHAQANSSEAGIRQHLKINAFPVILDEAEGEDHNARKRLQGILELMRQASSETGAPILKGSTGGQASVFLIRSAFVLSSIGVNITQRADASRVTVLSLGRPNPHDAVDIFDELKAAVATTITKEWCASLRARALTLVPTIIANAQIFGRVIAQRFADQRIGDQYGALLAGAYSLTSDTPISDQAADRWVAAQDWDQQSSIEDDQDERRCIAHILEHIVTYQLVEEHIRIDKTVAEMIFQREVPTIQAEALERIGIKVAAFDGKYYVVISDSHNGIRKILRNSPWENTWGRMLKRLKGAIPKAAYRFSGAMHRATAIPHETIFEP